MLEPAPHDREQVARFLGRDVADPWAMMLNEFAEDLAALDPMSSVWSMPPAVLAVGDLEYVVTVVAEPAGYEVVKHSRSTRHRIAHSRWLVDALRHLTCTLCRPVRHNDPLQTLVTVPARVRIEPLGHDSVLHWQVDGVDHRLRVRDLDAPILLARAAFATRDEIVASLRSVDHAPLFTDGT